jgi:hypothetical protein
VSYLPHYEHEVVLGASEKDDRPYGEIRWVSQFYQDLCNRLLMTFDGDGELRFDRVEVDSTAGHPAMSRCATLVAVLSPGFGLASREVWPVLGTVFAKDSSRPTGNAAV